MTTKIKFATEAASKSISKSARQLGHEILRDQQRQNNEFFKEHHRRYRELVRIAATGGEIDPEEFASACLHAGIDAERWNADIARMEKRFALEKIVALGESRMAQAMAAEAKLDDLIATRTKHWNELTTEIRNQEEIMRAAIAAHDECLQAKDDLGRMRRPPSAEEIEIQQQILGTDRVDGYTTLGHKDGVLDRIHKCEQALNPNANHGEASYVALRCDEWPAVVIRECEHELAQLKQGSAAPPAERVAKLENRIRVAKQCIEVKKAELADLRKQEAALRQRQAELAAANAI
jgi:hypothetical protein